MGPTIRDARLHDAAEVAVLVRIAAAGGSPDADPGYLRFVSRSGRLLVASAGGDIVGFGGAIQVDGVAMVTDLFVDTAARGGGVGTHLLRRLLSGVSAAMTFSSTHPAALPVYAAAGLVPRWRLLTVRGVATGGGPTLGEGEWEHDRADLVDYLASRGAHVGAHHVVQPARGTGPVVVLRLVGDDPVARLTAVLGGLPAGQPVELSVAEPHPAARWLLDHGFGEFDDDVFCSTDGVHLPSTVISVHRGLM